MTVPKRDTLRHTYADYLAWSRSSGDELIDGVAYVKEPPAPSPIHQGIVAELCRQVGNALEDWSRGSGDVPSGDTLSRVFVSPFDVRLPKSNEQGDEIDTVVQPDVLIICDRLKTDSRGIRGAPDWIAEVLSPSTAGYDQIVKLPAYERAGVAEVWLIHPIDRTVAIYRLEEGRYGRATILELKGHTQISAVPAVTIDWDRVIGKIA
jgi:Uma2 family endonuclease